MKYKTNIGITVELKSEGRQHIIKTHPVMEDYLPKLSQILKRPNEIRLSSRNDDVLLFYRFFDNIEDGKYIVVVVNKVDGLVKTAYLTHRIKLGRKYEE